MGDIRESPVSQLRSELEMLGARVAWHDPLVQTWEGTQPVELDWDCHISILATKQPGMNLDLLVSRGVQILDCTNSANEIAGLIPL